MVKIKYFIVFSYALLTNEYKYKDLPEQLPWEAIRNEDKYLRTVFLSRYPRYSMISWIFFASAQNLSIRSSIPSSLSRGFSLLSGGIMVSTRGISVPTEGISVLSGTFSSPTGAYTFVSNRSKRIITTILFSLSSYSLHHKVPLF